MQTRLHSEKGADGRPVRSVSFYFLSLGSLDEGTVNMGSWSDSGLGYEAGRGEKRAQNRREVTDAEWKTHGEREGREGGHHKSGGRGMDVFVSVTLTQR